MDRESEFEQVKKETNLLGAWDTFPNCPYEHKAMWMSGFDACLSLLQWKRIETADDLPKEIGLYVVRGKFSFEPYLLPLPYDFTNKWEKAVEAYIPITIISMHRRKTMSDYQESMYWDQMIANAVHEGEYKLIAMLKPDIFQDGDKFIVQLGEMRAEAETAYQAVLTFNGLWHEKAGENQ